MSLRYYLFSAIIVAFLTIAISWWKQKKTAKEKAKPVEKPKPILKVGDRVRMHDGRAIGSIDKIEKNKAVVNYGMFTTSVSMDQLDLVETIKK